MDLKTIVLGDEAIQVLADDSSKIETYKSSTAQKLADSEGKVGELTAKIAELSAKVIEDSEIDARVAGRLALVDQARTIKSNIVVDGKSDAEVMREVVADKYGEDSIKDMSDAAIAGMFRAATLTVEASNEVRNALSDKAPAADFNKRMADASSKFLKGSK